MSKILKDLSHATAVSIVEIRGAFAYDSDKVSQETGLACGDVSLTDQSSKEEVDINTLVARFGLTGEMPQITDLPIEADYVGLTTYQDCMNQVLQAQKAFESLPAELRHRFHHDPAEFVAFCSDEKNGDELIKLGLRIAPEPDPEPLKVRVIPAAEPPA